jgi:muconolactone D-isomerase
MTIGRRLVIYMLEVKIDYNQVGETLQEILPKEWDQTSAMYESGCLVGIWRKANAKGVVAIWDMPDHDAVIDQIRKMPLYPYMSEIEVTPLVAHPKYPEFCVGPGRRKDA